MQIWFHPHRHLRSLFYINASCIKRFIVDNLSIRLPSMGKQHIPPLVDGIDKPQEKVYSNGRTFMFHLEVQDTA